MLSTKINRKDGTVHSIIATTIVTWGTRAAEPGSKFYFGILFRLLGSILAMFRKHKGKQQKNLETYENVSVGYS